VPDPGSKRFSLRSRAQSFGPALRGLGWMIVAQHNARIHAVATLVVGTLAWALGVSRGEWLALLLAIGAVWATEAINSALEQLCDAVSPRAHPAIGRAKDVAAGAVLVAAFTATLVGVLVFAPRLLADASVPHW